MKESIFVCIASYRDHELGKTVRDCLNKAAHPERLTFGIHWQHDNHEFFEEIFDPRFKVIETDFRQSRGVCWARHEAQKLYDGEDFVMQIDSHMRFVHGWDLILIDGIRELQERGNKKVIISNLMPGYDPDDDQNLPNLYMSFKLGEFSDDGIILQTAGLHRVPPPNRFSPGFTLSAAFIFSIGDLYRDVIIDPDLYFAGEELSYAVRAYTHGYDIYHFHHPVIYHYYGRKKDRRHWSDHKDWWQSSDHAKARVRSLIAGTGEVPDLGPYCLGTVRTIEDYEYHSGIDFKTRTVTQFKKNGYSGPRAIRSKLESSRICVAQIDPFSYCNARCWYCPVRYEPQPLEARRHMPIELLEKIIGEICDQKKPGGVVSPEFNFLYTAHYNEVLLYEFLPEFFELLRQHGLSTMILTNGIALSPEKVALIEKFGDTIRGGICVNISRFERDSWIRQTMSGNGLSEKAMSETFDRTIRNIRYASEHFNHVSIQINEPDQLEAKRQGALAEGLFPAADIRLITRLSDRAGILKEKGVVSNEEEIAHKSHGRQGIVGCENTVSGKEGRHFGWLHVNALGEAILCCNDYYFDYIFGDFRTETLKDMWLSDRHVDIIGKSFREICTKCNMAIWK